MEVHLEGGGHLFNLHQEFPVLQIDDVLVHTDEEGSSTTYKIESRTFYCEYVNAPTESSAIITARPPSIKYTVSLVLREDT